MEELNLVDNGQLLQIRIDASFTADGVERLVHALAEARARMHPAVPAGVLQAMEADAPMLEIEEPAAHFGVNASGAMRITLRHGGLGWISFLLPPRDVEGIAELLIGKKDANRTPAH